MRTAFIRERLYAINAYLSGSDGKGYDAFQDDIGIDPQTFGKLHKARKRKLLEQVFGYVKNAIRNDLDMLRDSIEHSVRYDVIFDDLAQLGEAAGALDWLFDYYGASPLMKDWEAVEHNE